MKKRVVAVLSAFALAGVFAPVASADRTEGCRGIDMAFTAPAEAAGPGGHMNLETQVKLFTRYVVQCGVPERRHPREGMNPRAG